MMYDYSGSSFGAAVYHKKPLVWKKVWGMRARRAARSLHAEAEALWLSLAQDCSSAFRRCPPSVSGLAEPRHGSTFLQAKTKFPEGPRGGRSQTSSQRAAWPASIGLFHVNERRPKQERRNKSNTFITIKPERSEHDQRPPVVRRSVMGNSPTPHPTEHSLGDFAQHLTWVKQRRKQTEAELVRGQRPPSCI